MSGDQLTEADLPALQALARECLDRDGGLPAFADPPMLRARLLREQTLAVREAGRLVAAAGVTVDGATATASGMVAPGVRGRGLGSRLLRWTEDRAGGAALTVATETLGPDAERLYARHGLVRTFAEEVMRHDLEAVPLVPAPSGSRVVPMTEGASADLFTAYAESFAERPGFVEPTPREWLGELESDAGLAARPVRGGAGPRRRTGRLRQRPRRRGGFKGGRPPSLGIMDRPGRGAAGLARPRPGRAPGVEDAAGPGVRRSGVGLAHGQREQPRGRALPEPGLHPIRDPGPLRQAGESPRASRSR